MSEEAQPVGGLIETLELLLAQVQAYQRALPPNNYVALAAMGSLGELARQALTEARDAMEALAPPSGPNPLSPREGQVLVLVAQGLTNREVAYRLGISERTVQFHLNSVFNKTGETGHKPRLPSAFPMD